MNLAQRAQIIDSFLHELGHPSLVGVTFTDDGQTVHTREPHPDFDYRASQTSDGTHYETVTIRKGLAIRLVAYVFDEVAA